MINPNHSATIKTIRSRNQTRMVPNFFDSSQVGTPGKTTGSELSILLISILLFDLIDERKQGIVYRRINDHDHETS
jgi:hypothetical protein